MFDTYERVARPCKLGCALYNDVHGCAVLGFLQYLSKSVATFVKRKTPFALSFLYSSTTMPCGLKAAALCTAALFSPSEAMVVCKGYSLALKGVKASLMTPMRPELHEPAQEQPLRQWLSAMPRLEVLQAKAPGSMLSGSVAEAPH